MDGFVVMEPTGIHRTTGEDELKRLYYSIIDLVVGEMERRFSERNSQMASALAALNPQADNFLDVEMVRPILDLSQSPVTDTEFQVAKEFLLSQKHGTRTIKEILSTYHIQLNVMPSVLIAFKYALTFGTSTAMCENSFSILRNVFSDRRRRMLHQRKACLVQLAFERELTRKCTHEWRDRVL